MEEQITLSPIASGGGGTFFEQHVDAAFLVFLLVGAVPPFLQGSQLEEVHLQAGHLGWKTDDLLAVSRSSDGSVRKAAIQSKRSFTLTPTDPDCVDTFSKAWQDFSNQNLFEKGRDVLGRRQKC